MNRDEAESLKRGALYDAKRAGVYDSKGKKPAGKTAEELLLRSKEAKRLDVELSILYDLLKQAKDMPEDATVDKRTKQRLLLGIRTAIADREKQYRQFNFQGHRSGK